MLSITCPSCDAGLRIGPHLVGKPVRCPRCSNIFRIPEKETVGVVAKARLMGATLPRRRAVMDDDDRDWDEGEDHRPRRARNTKNDRSKALLWVLLSLGAAAFVLVATGGTIGAVLWLKREKTSTASSSSADARGYTIVVKEHQFPGGRSVFFNSSVKTVVNFKYYDAAGNFLKDLNQEQSEEQEYTETVIEREKRAPNKFQRVYAKAIHTADGVTNVRSFQGHTVTFQLRPNSDSYDVKADDPTPIAFEDQLALAKEAKKNARVAGLPTFAVPRSPVRLGQEWPVDKKGLLDFFPDDPDDEMTFVDGRATGKLTNVYHKNGKQYGTLEYSIAGNVQVNSPQTGKVPATLSIITKNDVPIDGSSGPQSSHMTMLLTLKFEVTGLDGQKVTCDGTVRVTADVESDEN
jgi:hypothetical protein